MALRAPLRLAAPFALAALAACAVPGQRYRGGSLPEPDALAGRGLEAMAAAPELPASASLDDCVAYAELHNPGLRAAFEGWRAALERVPQVTALPEPRISYAYFLRSVETRVGPQRHRFGLMQAFPWPGKLSTAGLAALAEAEAMRQQYEAARLAVVYRVKDAFFELYYLARSVEITRQNLDLVKYIESVARARYQVSGGQYNDVIRAQVEMGKLEDRLRTLSEMKWPLAARLNATLNRPTDAPFDLPKAIAHEQVAAGPAQVLAWLREASPELKALQAQIDKQKEVLDLARLQYYPDFTLGVSYIETGRSIMPTPDRGKDPIMAEVGLTLPIWRGKYRAAEREAAARLAAARAMLAERTDGLAAGVRLALFEFDDAGRKINLYADTLVPKANEALKATETAYKAGKATFADLIDAERVLLAFQLEHQRALATRAQRLAQLESLIGRTLPRAPAALQKGGEAGQPDRPTIKEERTP